VTKTEVTLLRSLAQAEVVTFMPGANTAGALARFETTVASLRDLQKAGWAELEVAEDKKRKRGHPQRKRAAAARCTEAGREALWLLGELRFLACRGPHGAGREALRLLGAA
jgi:hypothetical protein